MDMSGQTHNSNVLSLYLFKYGAMGKVKFWMIPKSSSYDEDSNDHIDDDDDNDNNNNNNNNHKHLTLMVF